MSSFQPQKYHKFGFLANRNILPTNGVATNSISIGFGAGFVSNGTSAIAIGNLTGQFNQGEYTIGLGTSAGQSQQCANSIAIGRQAGQTFQDASAVSIGLNAGAQNQGGNSISIGNSAGQTYQGVSSIAIGVNAGQGTQKSGAIAIGLNAGNSNQGTNSISIGSSAGQSNQFQNAIAIGNGTGQGTQKSGAIAIGLNAGNLNQGTNSIAIGYIAGQVGQGTNSISIGSSAGQTNQFQNAIAIGNGAGQVSQGTSSIAIGISAGITGQKIRSIALGVQASQTNQGTNSIAIGYLAGSQQSQNSIVISASGTVVTGATSNATYIAPIRGGITQPQVLGYNTSTNEITYFSTITAGAGIYGSFYSDVSQNNIGTPNYMSYNQTAEANGVSIQNDLSANPTRIRVNSNGVYNIQFSAQIEKTSGGSSSQINIWLVKNGINVPHTDTKIAVSGSSSSSYEVPAWNFVLTLLTTDYVQIAWYSSDNTVSLLAFGPSIGPPVTPAIPSVILTVTPVANTQGPTGPSQWNLNGYTITKPGGLTGFTGIGYTGNAAVFGDLYVSGTIDPTTIILNNKINTNVIKLDTISNLEIISTNNTNITSILRNNYFVITDTSNNYYSIDKSKLQINNSTIPSYINMDPNNGLLVQNDVKGSSPTSNSILTHSNLMIEDLPVATGSKLFCNSTSLEINNSITGENNTINKSSVTLTDGTGYLGKLDIEVLEFQNPTIPATIQYGSNSMTLTSNVNYNFAITDLTWNNHYMPICFIKKDKGDFIYNTINDWTIVRSGEFFLPNMVENLLGSNIWNLNISINLWNMTIPVDKSFAFYIDFKDRNNASYSSFAFNQSTPFTRHSISSGYNNTSKDMMTYTYTDLLDLTFSSWDGSSGNYNIWWYGDEQTYSNYNIVISITRSNQI